jgi:hypothetical protein
MQLNPGRKVDLVWAGEGEGPQTFDKMAVFPMTGDDTVRASQQVGALDGTYLRGIVKGVLLIFSILTMFNTFDIAAYAVVPVESGPTWLYFLTMLITAFPSLASKPFLFIADRDKGLGKATTDVFTELLPDVKIVNCVLHIVANLVTHCKKLSLCLDDAKLHLLVFAAARATTTKGLDDCMEEMREYSAEAHEYMDALDKSTWTLLHCPRNRHGQLV